MSRRREPSAIPTELGKDLGVDGDDAVELMENFAKKFQVDLSTFNFDKYFCVEAGFNPVIWIISVILNTSIYNNLEPLTVQDLINAAKANKWLNK